MTPRMLCLAILGVSAAAAPATGAAADREKAPGIYVPYKDVASLIGVADKAVLMDRQAFEKLLAAAEANERAADQRPVAQITRATYRADVQGEALKMTGSLTVVSLSDRPVSVPLGFGRMGLGRITLDGKEAPLGYDRSGRLVLVVTGRGAHTLAVAGSTLLKELKGGGVQFGLSLPTATAGAMTFSAQGDLEVHATVPVASTKYDKQADRTDVALTLGGHGQVTVVLMGNGRQEDQRAILLGTSAMTVQLTRADQSVHCLYTVQVLRRGVRELTFAVPGDWTVTDVSCPSLVRWSVAAPAKPGDPKRLTVRLRTASRGTKAVHIQAAAPRKAANAWASGFVRLQDADFEHGHLLVDTGGELAIRGQTVRHARRKDLSLANFVPGLIAATQGRMFYHWSDDWSVGLDLADAKLRKGSEARHRLLVTPEEVTLASTFQVTAIGRELFDLAFDLPGDGSAWRLHDVKVNGKDKGFEYRLVDEPPARVLKIALAGPVRREGAVNVAVTLRHVPADWQWPTGAAPRELDLPIVRARADTVSGHVAVAPTGDLDVAAVAAPAGLKKVNVGRMSLLGLAGDVQLAYTYEAPVAGLLKVRVSRRSHRLAAGSIGLVTATANKLTALWRINYGITRAHARKLYLLADKALGRNIKIAAPGRHLSSQNIVAPGTSTVELAAGLAKAYDLWELVLDGQAIGDVTVSVQYDRPVTGSEIAVPLIRPIGAGQITEMLAVQASEELAVAVRATAASDVDAIDLPPLPAQARRLLRAFRLEAPATAAGSTAAVRLTTKVHENYVIPAAVAADVHLKTHLGASGRTQRTEAVFRVANAGVQFLTVRLPAGAELWSVEVAGKQAKPKQSGADTYRVHLPRSAKAQEIKVVYAWDDPAARGTLGRVKLGPASLVGIRANRLRWTVVPPPGDRIARQYTDMEPDRAHRPKLAGVAIIDGLKDLFGATEALLAVGSHMMAQRAATDLDYAEQTVDEDRTRPAEEDEERLEGEARPDEARKKREKAPVGVPPVVPGEKPADKKPPRGPRTAKPKGTKKPKPTKPPAGKAGYDYFKARAVGRYTLPVRLVGASGSGPAVTYSSLGESELEIGLASETATGTAEKLGLLAALLVGFVMIRCCPGRRAAFVAVVLAGSTVVAIWWPGAACAANGAFLGALLLIPVYLAVGCLRWLWRKLFGEAPNLSPTAAAAAALLVAIALTAGAAHAGGKAAPTKGKPRPPVAKKLPPMIVPYEGDPTKADQAKKVLVPYRRFVELWNRANPDRKIDVPAAPVEVSLAGVQYAAAFDGERMSIALSARVKTFGRGAAVLPVPMSGLAVQSATLDGQEARLQVGPKGMILTLPGEAEGVLKITAVTTPKKLGRRASVRMSLPPLPGAILTVDLPAGDLELEVPGVAGALTHAALPAGKGVRWTVPLGLQRDVTLKWSPKVGAGAADRTLSAAAAHDVHAFHWAMVGVSKFLYSFSAGSNDRFGLLLPAGLTLTDLAGANLRDFREAGERTVDGVKMKVIEVRLHRAATKTYELTARWVGKLPALDKPARVALPRAADVGREGGTVTLHAAGGMTLKVLDVTGGRRSTLAAGKGAKAPAQSASTRVARYYWPYRPFTLNVQLSRQDVRPTVRLDQLVRVDRRQVQLLVRAALSAKRGRLFGASFLLPGGYELLSAIGPAVEDHYEQPAPTGRHLHVSFRSGVTATNVALVLVRKDAPPEQLAVPSVSVIDAAGEVLAEQAGRLAVQVAASLEAETAASENLRSVAPRLLRGWLAARQTRAVQFAYSYEKPKFSLRLNVRPQKTKVRVEVFGGLMVNATSAWYSYRLRYWIEGTPVDQVRFTLPTKYAPLVAVRCPAMRSVTKRPVPGEPLGRTEWTVALVNEVTGTLDVTANFAVPVDAATTGLEVPRIDVPPPGGRASAREGYRAILAVQNVSRHKLRLIESKQLVPLAQSEQRKLLAENVRKNLQFVLQSFTDDWSAILELKAAKAAARVQAIVDLMALTTAIDRAGRCRYEARLMLQNRTRQFLRVKVPSPLRLWSATVAGQAVKPVIDKAAAPGVVLIPLVKTSPGGLPYDVTLYLAGRAAQPLGLLTELRPPAIAVLGVKVERTTWSLRLPTGYRYFRPGGTLSPAAEGDLSITELQALYSQSKRLVATGRDIFLGGSHRGQIAASANWGWYNKKIEAKYAEAHRWMDKNRGEQSKEQYEQQKRQLKDLSSSQYGLQDEWARNVRKLKEQDGGAINPFLNNDATNGGVAEIIRNGDLNVLPGFVRSAAEGQRQKIAEEIRGNEILITNAGDLQTTVAAGTLAVEGGKLRLGKDAVVTLGGTLDLGGQQILTEGRDRDKRSQVAQVLQKLQADQLKKQWGRQEELKSQLALLGDNRLKRYYGSFSYQAEQAQAGAQGQGQAQQAISGAIAHGNGYSINGLGVTNGIRRATRGTGPAGRATNQPAQARPVITTGGNQLGLRTARGGEDLSHESIRGRSRTGGATGGGRVALFNNNGPMAQPDTRARLGEAGAAAGDVAGFGTLTVAAGETGLAVARGTFSLPVSLPAGGIRRDFAGPKGEPVVTLLAVDEQLIDGAYSTGAVLVIAVVVWLVWQLWRQRRRGEPVGPRGLVPAYLVLGVVLAALVATGGMSLMAAIVLFGAILCPVELIHRLLSRRAAAAPAA